MRPDKSVSTGEDGEMVETWPVSTHSKNKLFCKVSLQKTMENIYIFVPAWLDPINDGYNWIGMTDRSVEGGFIWTDGSAVAYVNWNDGEPNNAGEEDCVIIHPYNNGGWNDVPCNYRLKSVCEKRGDNYKPPPPPDPIEVKCQEGWISFQERCYYFSKTKVNTWQDAVQSCTDINFLSTLTSVTSKAELEFILCELF